MRHLRYEAWLNGYDTDGKGNRIPGTRRKHAKQLASSRDRQTAAKGRARLRNPHPYPASMQYLHLRALALYGRSGFTESGMNPLSPPVLESWARMEGIALSAQEREALFELDAALRSTGEDG